MPTPAPVPDSHCHLDFPDFTQGIEDVIGNARNAGVTPFITICTKLSEIGSTLEIAGRFDDVFFAAGIHPHWAASEPAVTSGDLLEVADNPKMVAIGESGLDYHYTRESEAEQKRSFRVHIEAARQSGLPLIVHSRDADDDMMAILADEFRAGPFGCIMHCFSSGEALASCAVELGFYISVSGIVTFRNSVELRSIVSKIPHERLLVETDAPYLAPVPCRGRRNEPAYVVHTARHVAGLLGLDAEAFAEIVRANTMRAFPKLATAVAA